MKTKLEQLRTKIISEIPSICNVIGCNKEGRIKTHIGWICSEKCRVKIQKNIFRALMGWN